MMNGALVLMLYENHTFYVHRLYKQNNHDVAFGAICSRDRKKLASAASAFIWPPFPPALLHN